MKEALDNAIMELKRVDHLFYVSLKYTRTADMMKHMIERLISTFYYGIESLLKKAKDEKKISSIPGNIGLRCRLLRDTFNDPELTNFLNFYVRLRKIQRAKHASREEYRRHVTMTVTIDNGEIVEVNIDILKEYYATAKDFISYARRMVHGEEEL